jgi:hypothetical protein
MDLLVVVVDNAFSHILVEHINRCIFEFPRADTVLKQHVKFGKGATSRLRYSEIRVDDAEEADAALWKALLVT